ncbi:homoserine kinase [Wenzhouxiangella limi]|uniref:Homoserine kinase n=1 Tax=Wenzhouxiangella limi TaxID=2707351 RepID=A0A845VIQ9_9GAMM|nr:homoserine kinase [Wenzhouxiangella limi]
MTQRQKASAFAPASVGNAAVGFDLLGFAVEGAGDTVHACRRAESDVVIDDIRGTVTDLPRAADRNTAGRAVLSLLAAQRADFGVRLEINKGIPLGSGLGGSAASATAALVAVNALLDRPLAQAELYPYALAGETVASGSAHGDNVGPQLLGGLVLASPDQLFRIPLPDGLVAVVVHPDHVVETRAAREVLQIGFGLEEIVAQQTRLGLFLAGCYRNDLALIRAGLADGLIEPRRAGLIPGFHAVKQAALDHGALGASISGAGPSVFGWFTDRQAAAAAGEDMISAFGQHGLAASALVCGLDAPGARLLLDDEDTPCAT